MGLVYGAAKWRRVWGKFQLLKDLDKCKGQLGKCDEERSVLKRQWGWCETLLDTGGDPANPDVSHMTIDLSAKFDEYDKLLADSKFAVEVCQGRNAVVEQENKNLKIKKVALESKVKELQEDLAAEIESKTKSASASCEPALVEERKVCYNKLRVQSDLCDAAAQASKTTEIQLTEDKAICESKLEEQYYLSDEAKKASAASESELREDLEKTCDTKLRAQYVLADKAGKLCAHQAALHAEQAALHAKKVSSLEFKNKKLKANEEYLEDKMKDMQANAEKEIKQLQEDLKFTREKLHEEREKNKWIFRFPNIQKFFGDKSKALMKWVEQKWNRMFNRGSNDKNTKKDKKGGDKKEKEEEPEQKPWWRRGFGFERNKDKDNKEGHTHTSREK